MQSLLEQVAAEQLWRFPGGVHPPTRKAELSKKPIASLPLPDKLYIPLRQHIGVAGHCLVQKGDHVMKGQPLTMADNSMSVPVHAPTSGLILAVTEHTSPHPSALPEPCIVLEPDGLDEWRERAPLHYSQCSTEQLLERIQQSGIAGMGGAGFPTHLKSAVQQQVELLIINGVECEPYISADDALMQEQADTIVQGIEILCHILEPKAVLIAIEDDKPAAISAMQSACHGRQPWFIRSVPTKYPSGGEKQLIQLLTGQEVPAGRRPIDIGMMMFNVGTSFAVAQAVLHDIPLVSRIVTVAGDTLQHPQNVLAPIGTPVSDLLHFCGFQPERPQRVIMGGPMMGFTLPDLSVPVIKTTNCILAPTQQELPAAGEEMDCIRCTACAEACPASLLPQQLLWFSKAKDTEKLDEYNLFDCIECGACAYVCPSEIPLVQYYRVAKAEIREQQREALKAEQAKARFEARQARLEAEKLERQRRNEQLAVERAAKQSANAPDAVAAALARVKSQQQQTPADLEAIKAERERKKQLARERQAEKTEAPANAASATDPRQAAIAAALARAKAKKQAAASDSEQVHPQQNQPEQTATKPAETAAASEASDPRQAAIAAALARAKAKKQAAASASDTGQTEQEQAKPAETEAEQATQTAAEPADTVKAEPAPDPRKAAIAAAIARAKAKKQAEATPASEKTGPEEAKPEQADAASASAAQTEATEQPSDPRKAAIAAAIARAKAKKLKETEPK
ncbi:electron transport complex subunit RsxC [Alkalimonas sp.]|uniref:electron transport complex subunit RsxC n=1 Tax=Alkalimonas sp. TaxID=1872453 RepID=UPI00263B82C9|nr:electron transport complex subunit RsxC [Alkalimonas sp.]MCC5827518.1 electron transport complex subunit RsxC [Alkalimonas sp.]